MKKLLIVCFMLPAIASFAQQKEGKVIYERTMQMQISFSGSGPGGEQQMPRSRKDKMELNFADNKMILKTMEEEMPDENFNSGGMVIRTFGGGADDATFCDFTTARKTEARELFEKKFLIVDTIRRGNWKLTDETKQILNFNCRKATTVRIAKRNMMSMENGVMQRKEIDDTSTISAWFTMDIPVPGAPEFQGQLPGMVLELETNNGRLTYKAIEVSPKPDMKALKEPSKGKKLTPEEFAKTRTEMFEQMQQNNPGGNMRIRMN